MGARIMAVADASDALTSSRPYRAAMPHATVTARLGEASGRTLDEDAVVAFVNLLQTLSTARPDVDASPPPAAAPATPPPPPAPRERRGPARPSRPPGAPPPGPPLR